MATTTPKPVDSQVTPDGQRVVETFEVKDDEGNKSMDSVARASTMAEQTAHVADDIMRWAVGTITLAKSGTVEVGGSDDAPTVTITLSGADPDAPVDPGATPKATSSKASSSS